MSLPRTFTARYGASAHRALVLGGGGPFIIAWQLGYLEGLRRLGVDVTDADLIVGTSGGSVVASLVTCDKTRCAAARLNLLSHVPAAIRKALSPRCLGPARTRATALFVEATDGDPETIRAIGHAALALPDRTTSRLISNLATFFVGRGWPSKALKVVTVDARTGERLVVDASTGVHVGRAVAASCAVPGMFPLQNIKGRRCMDGGVAGSATHCDLVAGAERALVLAVDAQIPFPTGAMTTPLGALEGELSQLAATGTRVVARGPSDVVREQLLSVDSVPAALLMGSHQAGLDVEGLREFWVS